MKVTGLLASAAAAALVFAGPTLAATYRPDARCGPNFGGAECDPKGPFGGCCSEYGWCGKTDSYCYRSDARCGKDFGNAGCNPKGLLGPCCSPYGWCGSSDAYCRSSLGCQSGCAREFTIPDLVATVVPYNFLRTNPPSPSSCGVFFIVTDETSLTTTNCSLAWDPTTTTPKALTPCTDPSFEWNFAQLSPSCLDFSLHIEHTIGGATNKATAAEFSWTKGPPGTSGTCAANGYCDAFYQNATDPILVPFS